jgi:hypothetical protein
LLKKIKIKTPVLIYASAKLKTYSKKVKDCPPINGSHSGHVQVMIGNCNMSTTLPKNNGAYPASGQKAATWP